MYFLARFGCGDKSEKKPIVLNTVAMHSFLFLILTLVLTTAQAQILKKLLLKQHSDVRNVQIIPCKSEPNLFIAILQQNPDWWETLSIVSYKNGKIAWQARFDSMPVEQSIRNARQIRLKGFANPLIEVYGETHQGNGFFYLYELKGRTARLLTMTRAVDENADGTVEINGRYYDRLFRNGILHPTYRDYNRDGVSDIKLTGTVLIGLGEDRIYRQYPAQKVLLYNKTKRKFVEDLKQRKGFTKEDD